MMYVPEPPRMNSHCHTNENDQPTDMDIDVENDLDFDDSAHHTEGEQHQDGRLWEEHGKGGVGFGLLVWSDMSMLDSLRGMRIQRCYHQHKKHNGKTNSNDQVAMVVHAKVTEAFVLWWENVQNKQRPKTLYLMDPRTCGTDAVLRVLEGIAVQGAKEERQQQQQQQQQHDSFQRPQLRLSVPQWLVESMSCAAAAAAAAAAGPCIAQTFLCDSSWEKRRHYLLGMCDNVPLLLHHLLPSTPHQIGTIGNDVFVRMIPPHEDVHDDTNNSSQTISFNTNEHRPTWLNVRRPYPMQQLAILSSLIMPLTLVVGPPGTGKTDTVAWSLVALCENLCHCRNVEGHPTKKKKIIITAHSNKALDQMVVRLLELYGEKRQTSERQKSGTCSSSSFSSWSPMILRLGHVDSMNRKVYQECSMKAWLSPNPTPPTTVPTPAAAFTKQPRPRRQDIMARADIYAMTVSGACLRRFSFRDDIIIGAMVMEEAAKITQPEAVAVLSYHPERVVMVGDPLQLSPVIQNQEIRERTKLNVSLFERLMSYATAIVLNQQGRATPELCNLYRWRYSNLLDLPPSVSSFSSNDDLAVPCRSILDFIDVPMGTTEHEVCAEEGEVIVNFVQWLINVCQIAPSDISVLTPYRAQRSYLQQTLASFQLGHVATVDEFQGLQNEIIVVSLVHRGQQGPSEFLSSPRRINVLTSRGKQSTYLVGRKSTYENGAGDWQHILHIIATYKSTLPSHVLEWWQAAVHACVHSTQSATAKMVTQSTFDEGDVVMSEAMKAVKTMHVVDTVEQMEVDGEGEEIATTTATTAVAAAATKMVDPYDLSNSLHCRIVGSELCEKLQWSAETIELIRDHVLIRVLNTLPQEKAHSFVYDIRDSAFGLLIQAAAKKCGV